MYHHETHQQIQSVLAEFQIDIAGKDNMFYTRMVANAAAIHGLYDSLYGTHPGRDEGFLRMIRVIAEAHTQREQALMNRDEEKMEHGHWYLGNELTGMSLYTDRFCGTLSNLSRKLEYFTDLGVNLLHVMPLFQSPEGESDGGYAVSDFRKVESRFGTLTDLKKLRRAMHKNGMYLMLDIVLNHTSDRHDWARRARKGDTNYQQYYYMFDSRDLPDQYDRHMPEVFPESSPGNFTFLPECKQWVMTVFHHYQWDLNYTNPMVFSEMLSNILFYANLGVDILRIDAPAFIWKKIGTSSQNLPEAHALLRMIRLCVQVAAPGMALLAEAIVSPSAIMKYFGTGPFTARECDFAYNATQMALQWDALATGSTGVMMAAQHELLQKPFGTSWITYTRCHDDIGLGYEDYMIRQAGFDPLEHRKFLQNYYSGNFPGSPAMGALFSVNPKTQDARISGSLASLCGLEQALKGEDQNGIRLAINRILLMQAHSMFIGGVPMLYYGDEAAYTNDYSYLEDPGKSYDNRWMHRPLIDWAKNERIHSPGTPEEMVFTGTRKLILLRKRLAAFADFKNISWMNTHSPNVCGMVRTWEDQRLFCLFNFSGQTAFPAWASFREYGPKPVQLMDHWTGETYTPEPSDQYLVMEPFSFMVLEVLS